MKKIPLTIGVAVYNEGQNVENFLRSIINQRLTKATVSEIIIVSSGSTDKTNKIIKSFSLKNLRIKLIKQARRLGKASAVNLIIEKAKEDIIVLASADLFIPEDTIEKLVAPLKNAGIGIVGSHPVPLNNPNTFFGYAAHLLWGLHHVISLESPKMGECIAFRKVFRQIPALSSVDEANIESLIKGQGYKAVYAPHAIIYNKGAESLRDFVARRRHVYAGHLVTKYNYGYSVSTISGVKIFFLLLKNLSFSWRSLLWTSAVILLEAYSRILGFIDYKTNRKYTIWQVTSSTKSLR